jgi:hypothetical protein
MPSSSECSTLGSVVLLTLLLASCSGGLFSSDAEEEGPTMPAAGAGMTSGGSLSHGGSGGVASSGGSSELGSGEAGEGGAPFEPPGGAGAPGAAGSGPLPLTIDPGLSPELTNPELMPTTLDGGVELSEELEAFEIVTPNTTYRLNRATSAITTALDTTLDEPGNWLGAPDRAIGIISEQASPQMLTIEDTGRRRPERVRLISESIDGGWRLCWDFMLSHVTLHVEKAATPFAFAFRGAPGGSLDTTDPSDRLVTASGAIYGTASTLEEDFLGYESGGSLASYWSGPVEWAYLYDTINEHSMFLVQHHDDDAAERFQVIGTTALVVFGNQAPDSTPKTFSFGLIDDNVHQLVEAALELAVAIDP